MVLSCSKGPETTRITNQLQRLPRGCFFADLSLFLCQSPRGLCVYPFILSHLRASTVSFHLWISAPLHQGERLANSCGKINDDRNSSWDSCLVIQFHVIFSLPLPQWHASALDFPFLLDHCCRRKKESEVAQWCPTLFDPMDCSLPGFSIPRILQARVLEWVAISFSRESSQPWDWTQVSHIVGRRFMWCSNKNRNA